MTPATLGPMAFRPAWVSPVIPWEFCDPPRREALREEWSHGELSHQLTPSQRATYAKLRAWEKRPYRERGREFCLDSSRRWGKSKVGCTWLTENALRRPGRYLYIGPERKQIEDLMLPLMEEILSECPPELRPRYHAQKRTFVFPNGSRIELYGLDKNPNASRGGRIDGAFLDECGFFKRLLYLVKSVLKPQMFGRTWACLLLASTPPDTPAHPWSNDFIPRAIMAGGYDKRTIEDADQWEADEIEAFIEDAGGREDPNCRREYFAEHVADAAKVLVPEYEAAASRIVREVEPPAWRDCYTDMDPGWHDLVAVLFGYWHFEDAKLIVEDELAEVRLNSGKLADQIRAKELELWAGVKCVGSAGLRAQPYRRYTDRDPRLVGDLKEAHDLKFSVAKKDSPEQGVNQIRVAIQQERILIHPRCVKLQAHLRHGIWKNEQHKAFAWQGGIFGHFDLVATLVYMWRNVNRKRNPQPKAAVFLGPNQHMSAPPAPERKAATRWTAERQPSAWSKAGPAQPAKWQRENGRLVRVR